MQNNSDNHLFTEKPVEQGFGVKDFILRYLKYLPLVVVSLLIAYAAAKIKIRYSTETFVASGTMIIKEDRQGGGGDKSVEDIFTQKSKNDLATEIQLMKSRFLMRRVVKKLGLQNALYTKGKVKTSIVYGSSPVQFGNLSPKDSLAGLGMEINVVDNDYFTVNKLPNKIRFGAPVNSNSSYVINKTEYFSPSTIGQRLIMSFIPIDNIASGYSAGINIKQVGDFTRILEVSMVTESAQLSTDVVNTLMQEYINQNEEDNKLVSEITKKFINDRVNELEGEVGSIEDNLKNFRERTQAIDLNAQAQSYLSNVNDAREGLYKERLLLGTANNLSSYIKKDDDIRDLIPVGLLDEPNIQNLILEFNNTQLERKRIRERFSELDLTYIEKTNQARNIRSTILAGLSKIVNLSEITISELESKFRENAGKLSNIPYLQKELKNYDRDKTTKEELYLFLKKKGEEAGITSVSTLSNSKLIDPSMVNYTPVTPVRSKIFSIAMFLGLIIPAAIAYLLEVFNDKVRYRDDIQKLTRAPIVAEIGHNGEGKTLVVQTKSRKVIAEQFRMVRTNIQYLVGNKEKYTVLITSTFSGEGKSFISTNVAAAIALTGKKTVLLEFDLRKPKVLEGLDMKKSAGITNFVVGKAAITDIIKPVTGTDNLFVIPCGAIPPNPAELLLEDNIDILFEYLNQNFDAIVIDSAPVGLVTDSMTLSKYADCTLYIVRHKYTLKKQIKLIDELYINKKLPKLSIVINDVIGSTGGYYGYGGYGYGYGKKSYGYGTGYFEEEQKSFFKDAFTKIKRFLTFWK